MKTLVSTAALLVMSLFSASYAQNSLENTAWEGDIFLGIPLTVVLKFEKDTVSMYSAQDSRLIEKMTYTNDGNTFTWKKVVGGSPCDPDTPGTWQYEIKDNEISFEVVDDPCSARSDAKMGDQPFRKVAFK